MSLRSGSSSLHTLSSLCLLSLAMLVGLSSACVQGQEVLPDTQPLMEQGDLALKMVEGIDRFLKDKLAASPGARDQARQQASPTTETRAAKRQRLSHLLGLRDTRPQRPAMELVSTFEQPAEIAHGANFKVLRVRWQAIENADGATADGGVTIHGEGLMLEPAGEVRANVVAIPDAEQSAESLAQSGYAPRLAASGCRVVIPCLVSRRIQKRRHAMLTDREYLYRSAFALGRQLTGYELQKVLAVVDWFDMGDRATQPIAVVGWGEGGRLALYAAALEDRIQTVCISGYFGPREAVWNEPLDRNVFGLLHDFGDAELAAMKQTGQCIIDTSKGPIADVKTRGGAPYQLEQFHFQATQREATRAEQQKSESLTIQLVRTDDESTPKDTSAAPETTPTISEVALQKIATCLKIELQQLPEPLNLTVDSTRQNRAIAEIDQFNQNLLIHSPYERKKFFKQLDVSSVAAHQKTVEWYRDYFRKEVIGEFDDKLLPPNVRTRKVFDEPKWTGYEVTLDVFPNVFAYGILLLPKDLKANEKRPVVVCQHGLEGRPRNVIEKDHPAYHDYAAKLAERGFITFSPQNIYIFEDGFRTLQRKANPLGKTLFSIMVPQHQQIVDWLAQLPMVDADRIAFYGLSYGGKSAMRIPPLVDRYCLSICSADFNDWVWKNVSTKSPYSYVWTGEYEIFEWDLGSTFNYSEMAALIAPKPFMVERGHFDGVAPDERVALEFAKVRHLYQAKLGIGDRCELEFFVGPHTINGKGTFEFLHRHLDWPQLSE